MVLVDVTEDAGVAEGVPRHCQQGRVGAGVPAAAPTATSSAAAVSAGACCRQFNVIMEGAHASSYCHVPQCINGQQPTVTAVSAAAAAAAAAAAVLADTD
jgi:hypothetical protein